MDDRRSSLTRMASACATILAVDSVLITLSTADCTRVTVATSNETAVQLDLVEQVVDGPSQHAFRTGRSVYLTVGEEQQVRWPAFVQAASRAVGPGLISAHPIESPAPVGVLTTFLHGSGDLPQSGTGLGAATAQLLATLLSQPDLTETFLDGDAVHALDTHLVATGMIMSRMGLGSDDAFALLRSRAYSHQETLTDTSIDIIEGRLEIS